MKRSLSEKDQGETGKKTKPTLDVFFLWPLLLPELKISFVSAFPCVTATNFGRTSKENYNMFQMVVRQSRSKYDKAMAQAWEADKKTQPERKVNYSDYPLAILAIPEAITEPVNVFLDRAGLQLEGESIKTLTRTVPILDTRLTSWMSLLLAMHRFDALDHTADEYRIYSRHDKIIPQTHMVGIPQARMMTVDYILTDCDCCYCTKGLKYI